MNKHLVIIILAFLVVITACGGDTNNNELEDRNNEKTVTEDIKTEDDAPQETEKNKQEITVSDHSFFEPHKGAITHIHGLGYAGNQHAIFFASHDGLRVYENGKWYKTKQLNNDYMGFNAVDEGFYASGHPGPGVNLPNPLGLIKSVDYGQTLVNLGMEGESDFHAMGVGYFSHTIYLFNETKNSVLDLGLFASEDDGQTWKEIHTGITTDKILNIAVHPTNSDIFAIASQDGIYLSKDKGESITLLTENKQGISVFFAKDALWYGAYGNAPELTKYLLDSDKEEKMTLPKMEQDAVLYFAKNPQNSLEIVFVTVKGDIYISVDGASTWSGLVSEGEILE